MITRLSSLILISLILFGCKTHENTTYAMENREELAKANGRIRDLAKGDGADNKRIYKEADEAAKSLEASARQISEENKQGWWGKFSTNAIALIKAKGGELVDLGGSILSGNYGKAATLAFGIASTFYINRQRKQVLLEKDKKKNAFDFINDVAWMKDDNEIKEKLSGFFKNNNKKKD